MKRIIIVIALVLSTVTAAQLVTNRVQPVMLSSPQARWQELGTITATNAYPAVTARSYAAVAALPDANTVTWSIDPPARKAMVAFQVPLDSNTATIQIMGFAEDKVISTTGTMALDDDALFCGTLVLTGGTQTGGHSNVYVDTATATDGVLDFSVLDGGGNNRKTVIEFSTKGLKRLVFIASSRNSATIYVEGRLY
jgi:hypothetical protein